MKSPKSTKKYSDISSERLAELKRATLIASTGSSLRISGSKVTNRQVEQIINFSKLSERK